MHSWKIEFGCGVELEFLRANDREQEIPDQQERDDAYNDVSHDMLLVEG